MKTYAAYSKMERERLLSSSGGVFSLIAKYVLSEKGVVYGVAMNSSCNKAEFVRVDSLTELAYLRGSKYLQASLGKTFSQVKEDLLSGRVVGFVGTACQINGLKLYLEKKYINLLCVDVMCHGVPSPIVWREYVSHIEKKHGHQLKNVNFRCKYQGWENFGLGIQLGNSEHIFTPFRQDPYMTMFLRNYDLRESCYNCVTKNNKLSDITIADFWGINDVDSQLNDDKGISLVITRTPKGESVFRRLCDEIVFSEVSYEDATRDNPMDYCSVKRPVERDSFFGDLKVLSFAQMEEKYCKPISEPLIVKLKRIVKSLLKKIGYGVDLY